MGKKKSKIRIGLIAGAAVGGLLGSMAASKIPVGDEKIKSLAIIAGGTGLTMLNNDFALGAGLGMCGAGGSRLGSSLGIAGADEVIIGDVFIDGVDESGFAGNDDDDIDFVNEIQ